MALGNITPFKPEGAIRTPSETGRYSWVVAGPGGTGKSWLMGTMAEHVGFDQTLLLATLEREENSFKYVQGKVPRIRFRDKDWQPNSSEPRFDATAFRSLLDTVEWLLKDEKFGAVILDSGTEASELAWHGALSPMKVASPADIDNERSRWLPYEALDNSLDQLVKGLVALTTSAAKRPKHVGITWHVQPQKDDQVVGKGNDKQIKESADNRAEGVEYEGSVLPMIRGKYRRKLITQVDAFVYTDMQYTVPASNGPTLSLANRELQVNYLLQVRPDQDRHTKVPGPLPDVKFIPNDFKTLLSLIDRHMAMKTAAEKASGPTGLSRK